MHRLSMARQTGGVACVREAPIPPHSPTPATTLTRPEMWNLTARSRCAARCLCFSALSASDALNQSYFFQTDRTDVVGAVWVGVMGGGLGGAWRGWGEQERLQFVGFLFAGVNQGVQTAAVPVPGHSIIAIIICVVKLKYNWCLKSLCKLSFEASYTSCVIKNHLLMLFEMRYLSVLSVTLIFAVMTVFFTSFPIHYYPIDKQNDKCNKNTQKTKQNLSSSSRTAWDFLWKERRLARKARRLDFQVSPRPGKAFVPPLLSCHSWKIQARNNLTAHIFNLSVLAKRLRLLEHSSSCGS